MKKASRYKVMKEVNEMHVKSSASEVRQIDPESGHEIEARPVDVNDLTKVLRFLGSFRGNNKFLWRMKWKAKKHGIGSLTDGEMKAVVKAYDKDFSRRKK